MTTWTDDEVGGSVWSEDEAAGTALGAATGSALVGFVQSGSGATARTVENKLRDAKHAFDIGCACDGSTDDYSKLNAYILGEVSAGRAPWIEFPPDTVTMVSGALPFRDDVGYICRGGFATIKAHSTSTDNVIGEATPSTAYARVHMENIIVDGNRANVSYNTRNGGLTDDAYQNCLRLDRVTQSVFRNVRTTAAVMNGWAIYNTSNDNIFDNCWATDIGKSTNIVGGFSSYNGFFIEFGCNRNKFLYPYVNVTREHGIWQTCNGGANSDNEYIEPLVLNPGADGIRFESSSGTDIDARPKVICPTVRDGTGVGAVGIRFSPNAGGSIDDPLLVSPIVTGCTNGIVTANVVNRLTIVGPKVKSNTSAGITIDTSAVDAEIIGGYSLSNGGAQFTDNGTRTLALGLVTGTGGLHPFNKGLDLSGASSGQIKFPASQNASADANTLDDYEEGTFTPVIIGTSGAGTGTYSTQTGRYTKVGNRVHFFIELNWSAHTGTGNIRIQTLPFAANAAENSPCAVWASNLTFTGQLVGLVLAGSTDMDLYTFATGAGAAGVAIDTAAQVFIQGSYAV